MAWIAVATLLFVGLLAVLASGDPADPGSADVIPSSYSRSAIGYAGIVDVLRQLGVPIVISRGNALARLGTGGVLVLAEPRPGLGPPDLGRMIASAPALLLVLPKWRGVPSTRHPGWIADADLVPIGQADWALSLVLPKSRLVRRPGAVERWTVNGYRDLSPTLAAPVQLVRAEGLKPIIATDDGVLLGLLQTQHQRIWVLSDPDLLSDHGLAAPGNAAIAVTFFESARGAAGTVVFDETIHGYVGAPPNPLQLLLRFPFVVATAFGVVAVALLLWATVGRFGAPEPLPPPLDAGRAGLIRSAARLLTAAGDRGAVAQRYVQAMVRAAASDLHAPPDLTGDALLGWLQRIAVARRLPIDGPARVRAAERAQGPALVAALNDIHRWKTGLVDEPRGHQRHR